MLKKLQKTLAALLTITLMLLSAPVPLQAAVVLTADAGPDQTIEATRPEGGEVVFNGTGSLNPEAAAMSYTWTTPAWETPRTGRIVAAWLPLGNHTVTLTVDNGTGTAADTMNVQITDTTPPVFQMLSYNASFYAVSPLTDIDFTDRGLYGNDWVDGLLPVTAVSPTQLPVGDAQDVLVRTVDHSGNAATTTVQVNVLDLVKPTITLLNVMPSNHYMDTVTPIFSAEDNESGLASLTAALDGQPFTSGTPVTAPGFHVLAITARDVSGNQEDLYADFQVLETPTLPPPSFEPQPGHYHFERAVSIYWFTPNTNVFYTTDGSTPTRASTLYTGTPILVSGNMTIKAISVAEGWRDSSVATGIYEVHTPDPPAQPVITVTPNTEAGTNRVTITSATAEAVIRYSLAGQDPRYAWQVYTGPFELEGSNRVRAIAEIDGNWFSEEAVPVDVSAIRTSIPIIVPGSGARFRDETVQAEIYSATPDARIYYTTDGSAPSDASTPYAGPFQVPAGTTIRAIAYADGLQTSSVAEATYRIKPHITFTPAAGPITGPTTVALTTDAAASLVYWLDSGSAGIQPYEGPFTVQIGQTAYAAVAGVPGGFPYDSETVMSATYGDGREQVAQPVISPASTLDAGTRMVTIQGASAGVEIRYTTDGSSPNPESTLYAGPFEVSGAVTVMAIALHEGMIPSPVAYAYYGQPELAPTADAGPDQTVDAASASGAVVTLYGYRSSTPIHFLTFTWTADALPEPYFGETLQAVLPIGVHTVTLTVSNGYLTGTDTVVVTVADLSPPTINAWSMDPDFQATGPMTTISLEGHGITAFDEVDGAVPVTIDGPASYPIGTSQQLTIAAVDQAGNRATRQVIINVYDWTLPQIVFGNVTEGMTYSSALTPDIQVTDGESGISHAETWLGGSLYTPGTPVAANGYYVLTVYAYDNAGNLNVASVGFWIDIQEPAPPPVFYPEAGRYPLEVQVDIQSGLYYGSVRYTTDETVPVEEWSIYYGPITLTETTTIRAFTVAEGYLDSPVASATYEIYTPERPVQPVITAVPYPEGGYHRVTIAPLGASTGTGYPDGTEIRYTLDGSDPAQSENIYYGYMDIESAATVRAVAAIAGRLFSVEAEPVIFEALRVAVPVFAPGSRRIYGDTPTLVTIESATPGATIHYTTNGSNPTIASPVYTGPLPVTAGTTVRAIARKDGLVVSRVATATYDYLPHITFSPPGGPIAGPTTVALDVDQDGLPIGVWLDGFSEYPIVFWGPFPVTFEVDIGMVVQAAVLLDAYSADWETLVEAAFTDGRPTVDTPVISPGSTTENGPHMVTITSDTPDAMIYYTLDKSSPHLSSLPYGEPFVVSGSVTVRAIALKGGMRPSAIAEVRYGPEDGPPVADAGEPQTVEALVSSGAFVTLDASGSYDPDGDRLTCSWIYPAMIDGEPLDMLAEGISPTILLPIGEHTVRLLVTDGVHEEAAAVTITVTDLQANPPAFMPSGGTFDQPQDVWIVPDWPHQTVYYTLDGTVPTYASPTAQPIRLSTANTTIRAIAAGSGQTDSAVAEATYRYQVATPEISPGSGIIHRATEVSIWTTTPGATIRITRDGSEPTLASEAYTGPFTVTDSVTIKARAFAADIPDSDTAIAIYEHVPLPVTGTPAIVLSSGQTPGTVRLALTRPEVGADLYFAIFESEMPGIDPGWWFSLYEGEQDYIIEEGYYIYAFAQAPGKEPSPYAVRMMDLAMVEPPVITPAGSPIGRDEVRTVSITAVAGADIFYETGYYTLSTSSTRYTGPFEITGETYVRAFAVKEGLASSMEATAHYRVVPQLSFSPAPGPITGPIMVSITTDTPGREIGYWFNSTYPAWPLFYQGPFEVLPGTTVYAGVGEGESFDLQSVIVGEYSDGRERVALPVIDPPSTEDPGEKMVTITSATAGAEIRYTTDRTIPDGESPLYTEPFLVSGSVTVRAIAYAPDMIPSGVATAEYGPPNRAPVANAGADRTFELLSGQTEVMLDGSASSDPDGDTLKRFDWYLIRFVDDRYPDVFEGREYVGSGPQLSLEWPFGGSADFELVVSDGEYTSTDTVSVQIMDARTDPPSFSYMLPTFTGTLNVALNSSYGYADIHYTTDGSDPTHDSPMVSPGTMLSLEAFGSITLKAFAATPGRADSETVSAIYTRRVAPPQIWPAGGTIHGPTAVMMTTATEGAEIRYTLDGSTPDRTSALFTEEFRVETTQTVKAIAYYPDEPDSEITTVEFIFEVRPDTAAPVIRFRSGEHPDSLILEMASETPGAELWYTFSNPEDPGGSDFMRLYTEAVEIGEYFDTIRAIAIAPGMNPSAESIAFRPQQVIQPAISPASRPATLNEEIEVTITGDNPDAEIYYVVNRNDLSIYSQRYTGPFTVTAQARVQAFATREGLVSSSTVEAFYRVPPAIHFSPEPGPISGATPVTITCDDSFAMLMYAYRSEDGTLAPWEYYSPGTPVMVYPGWTLYAALGNGEMADYSTVVSAVYSDGRPRAATPVITPESTVDISEKQVTITSATEGATILYTLDGSDPRNPESMSVRIYSGPFLVSGKLTVKAAAYKDGILESYLATVTYGPVNHVPVAVGTVNGEQFEADSIEGALVTLDGSQSSDPDGDTLTYHWRVITSNEYGETFELDSSGVVATLRIPAGISQAILTVSDGELTDSNEFEIVVVDEQTNMPAFSQPGGTFSAPLTLRILPEVPDGEYGPGDQVFYTLDGSAPTIGSLTAQPIVLSRTTTVRAIAWYPGQRPSGIIEATYVFQTAAPTFSPGSGSYPDTILVEIRSPEPGATIFYTTDGSAPTAASTLYVGSFPVTVTTTVKAMAVLPGVPASSVAVAEYVLPPYTADPVITATPGPAAGATTVTLSDADSGSAIYYTLDGQAPQTSGGQPAATAHLYSEPIVLHAATDIRAFAVKAGQRPSQTVSRSVAFEQVATPAVAPASQHVATGSTVSISIAGATEGLSAGAEIWYTTDGSAPVGGHSVPAATAQRYTGAFTVTVASDITVRAVAIKAGMLASAESSVTYRRQPQIQFSPTPGPIAAAIPVTVSIDRSEPEYTIWYSFSATGEKLAYPVAGTVLVAPDATLYVEVRYGSMVVSTASANYPLLAGSADIMAVISPAGTTIDGLQLTATYARNQKSVTIDLLVSPGATWAIYQNESLRKLLSSPEIRISGQKTVVYIKVTSASGLVVKVYTLTLTQAR